MADEQQVAGGRFGQNGVDLLRDPALRVDRPFPAIDADFRIGKEEIRSLFEFVGGQEACRRPVVFVHGFADLDAEAEAFGQRLGGLDGLALGTGNDLDGSGEPPGLRQGIDPSLAHVIQPPLRYGNRRVDQNLRVAEIADRGDHAGTLRSALRDCNRICGVMPYRQRCRVLPPAHPSR